MVDTELKIPKLLKNNNELLQIFQLNKLNHFETEQITIFQPMEYN